MSFASPHTHGSAYSLTTKDQSDVGPLSCRVTFKPVSEPLQPGIRFFRPPKPAHPWARLAARCPLSGRHTGFPRFASGVRWVRCLLSTGRRTDHESPQAMTLPTSSTLLVQACQPLSLVSFHGLYCRFRYLHHTSYLALTRLVVARKGRLSRIGPRSSHLELRYIVRAATLFMPLGSPGGTGGLSLINHSSKRLRVAKPGKL